MKGDTNDHFFSFPKNSDDLKIIHPGEFYFSNSNIYIQTLLGSCIAITLWHPKLKIGGMCHFVFPGKSKDYSLDGRYSQDAIEMFAISVKKYGTELSQYQAKIFGGSNMLSHQTLIEDETVGNKNTVEAIRLLTQYNISLMIAHVGETGHRCIRFDIESGDVWVKHVPLQKNIPNT